MGRVARRALGLDTQQMAEQLSRFHRDGRLKSQRRDTPSTTDQAILVGICEHCLDACADGRLHAFANS